MVEQDPSTAEAVESGQTVLGIELGSTTIKAVLVDASHRVVASGSHGWENRLVDGLWTYSLEAVWEGLAAAYASLAADVERRHGQELTQVGAIGVSAMMHGYLAFDADQRLLVPFRTWRNTNTDEAARRLSSHLDQNIPHRWSIAHLYQAVIDREEHVDRIAFLTTLAGYVHWRLSGRTVLGVGDASGMFPIDPATTDYDARAVRTVDALAAEEGVKLSVRDLLPQVLVAGDAAGELSHSGAALLDPSRRLRPGAAMCPPEGDAGTGMVATNSIAPRTGNVSAGTSVFAMVVLEQPLQRAHTEIDLVTTPVGDPVAMVHCNNGASELDAWVQLFAEIAQATGSPMARDTIFETLVLSALDGPPDCAGLMSYNYLAGEPITGLADGRPLFVRAPDSRLTLPGFMRTQLYASLATLRIGMDVLRADEGVEVDAMFAHGGLFRTRGVAQRFLAAAFDVTISVGDVAAEGGAWGIALLASYAWHRSAQERLAAFLDARVFADVTLDTARPDPGEVSGFGDFVRRFRAGLPVERAASQAL